MEIILENYNGLDLKSSPEKRENILPGICLFSEVSTLNYSCFSIKIKQKRKELCNVYVSNLATSSLRAMGPHLVSNEIVRELNKLSVLYQR